MTALELLACVVLAGVSAWLSASEIALFSLSRFQLRSLKERFRTSHRKIKRLLADPSGLLVTLLALNELVNIGLSSVIARAIGRAPKPTISGWLPLPPWAVSTLLGLLVSTPIVLLLCDLTPKIVASRANRLIAPAIAGPLTVLYDLLKPVRVILSLLVTQVAKITSPRSLEATENAHVQADKQADARKLLREADFLLMLEEGQKEGAVQQGELDLIRNVFDLDDTTVADVYTPLPQVQTLTERTTLRSALNMMRTERHGRIPVTAPGSAASRRQIVGILYSKDLLKARLQPELLAQTVDAIMRKPLTVGPSVKLNSLFRKFKQQKTHMAIVQSPAGDALGVVTMNDVLDTLFEDILPELDDGSLIQ